MKKPKDDLKIENSDEPMILFRDNINPTKRKLPKSKFLKLQEQGKSGGYVYEIIPN